MESRLVGDQGVSFSRFAEPVHLSIALKSVDVKTSLEDLMITNYYVL